jgi:hypothetical protein
MGDGTAANGERVLKRESLEQMRDRAAAQAGHRRRHRACVAHPPGRRDPDLRARRDAGRHILLLEIVPERNFAIAILTNANTGWRLIQDVEREGVEVVPRRGLRDEPGDRARGLVETLPSVEPLARQPDPAPYVGTYTGRATRTSCAPKAGNCSSRIARARARTVRESPVAFYGPDRVVGH